MGNDRSGRGILDGILGGLTVSLFNAFIQQKNRNQVDWDNIDFFEPFSYAEYRKRDGYKLKYDIDESKVQPKIVNLLQINPYSYILKITNERIKGTINNLSSETFWATEESSIKYMLNDKIEEGIIILENILPKHWVCGKKESDDFVQITITDYELEEYIYNEDRTARTVMFCDEYPCFDIAEARELAKEMKRYYHNYVERVLILEEFDQWFEPDDKYYKDMILDTVPTYYNLLDMVNEINTLKYNEVSKLLYETNYEMPLYMVYTLYSLGMQLLKDKYYEYSKEVLDCILKVDKQVLEASGMEDIIYQNLINICIELQDEKEIIKSLKYKFKDAYYIAKLARQLYDLKFYEAANIAYRVVTENEDFLKYDSYLFEAFLRTEDDEGMKTWRDKLIKQDKSTFQIDRYLNDMDAEGLSIRISRCENTHNWEQVINYSNKYIKLTLKHPWKKVDDYVEYELKKVNAFIQLNKIDDAWSASCKARRTMMSNFNGVDYLEHLSKVEQFMADICLKQDFYIDTIYHYVFKIIYGDIFKFYKNPNKNYTSWKTDLFLADIIKNNNLSDLWNEIESMIANEYKNISGKSPSIISNYITTKLADYNYRLNLIEPKKYFPVTVPMDFKI